MSFIVTARKWRPQKFSDVVGQEHITTTLKNAIKDARIAHAYLFTGPRGVGKTTTARILAKTLNCLNPSECEPCNECEMCKSILSGQSLDIIEIDGASNRGIDEIRTLRDSVRYAPTKGKYKVYIIDEVHMLTKESFNAFLKTLEEPPAHTVFIFATTDAHKVPLTIISRCQRFDFRRIQLETIKSLLNKIAAEEEIEIDDKTLTLIGRKADGALRDAESYFDQVVSFCGKKVDAETVSKILNLIDDEIYFTISDAVLNKNFRSVFEVTDTIFRNGWNFIDFMDGLIEHFRNIMTVVLTSNTSLLECADIYKKRYLAYAGKFSEGDILRLLNFLTRSSQELRFSQNQKLKIEIALSHLIGLEKTTTISELIEKLPSLNETSGTLFKEKTEEGYKSSPEIKKKPLINLNPAEQPGAENLPPGSTMSNLEVSVFNFDHIVKKWQNFVDIVSREKALTLGTIIQNLKPVELVGNKLNIYINDEVGKTSISYNIDYLANKAFECFGKKLVFHFTEKPLLKTAMAAAIAVSSPESPQNSWKNSGENIPDKTEDPYVEAIIKELGGEELLHS